MKEKKLIFSFFAGGLADIVITEFALNLHGFEEANRFQQSIIEQGGFHNAAALRIATTAFLIGVYALSRNTKMSWSVEKATQAANLIVWAVNVLNAVQILTAIKSF